MLSWLRDGGGLPSAAGFRRNKVHDLRFWGTNYNKDYQALAILRPCRIGLVVGRGVKRDYTTGMIQGDIEEGWKIKRSTIELATGVTGKP